MRDLPPALNKSATAARIGVDVDSVENDATACAPDAGAIDRLSDLHGLHNARFLLRVEAWLLKLAHSHNKLLSLSNSRTRILAHQVECAYRIINALGKRFIIADEVGLGKTVEAGLVMKELEFRHGFRRVLIVCPASLQLQWQQEMRSKFNEEFLIMDGREMKRILSFGRSGNPWLARDRVICSIDFIKTRQCLTLLEGARWDTVIVDEAHRLRHDGRRSTLAYEAARLIARRTEALLLLTATPFRGKLEELYHLVSLIDPCILGPFQTFYCRYCIDGSDLSTLRERLAPILIRRTKREIGGFTRRCARTVRFELYPDERLLYDETSRYVAEEFNRALQSGNRAVGLVMTVFQKLLDSSTRALAAALSRRIARLERVGDSSCIERVMRKGADDDLLEGEDDVDEAVCGASIGSPEEREAEIRTLRRLVDLAAGVRADKKAERLISLLADLKKRGHRKFLIFTQFRTTQEFLAQALSGFSVAVFHGSLGRDEKEQAIARFRDEAEILISTEAGGEGRNMQFCRILINYDLPWSPLRIEQRIGRIHRFGQTEDVFIYNFATKNTVAERVLAILTRKLRLFEESIGMPDVLLGEMEDELRLNSLFMEMAAGLRSGDSVDRELELRLERARRGYEKIRELTVSSRMDFNYDDYYRVTLEERTFSNRRIERFVDALAAVDDHAARQVLPPGRDGLRLVACDESAACYRPGTFDSTRALENEELEFLAFGHPVIDRMVDRCLAPEFGGFTGVRVINCGHDCVGMVFYYLITFSAACEYREIMPIVVLDENVTDAVMDEIEEMLAVQPIDLNEMDVEADSRWRLVSASKDRFFASAAARLAYKLEKRKSAIAERLNPAIGPEIEKIQSSYDARIAELCEKAELLEAQHKWYGRNLKAAITRTRNQIEEARRERDGMIQRLAACSRIEHRTELLCCGLLIGRR